MQTVSESIQNRADALLVRTKDFLERDSGLHKWNHPGSLIITASNYAWNPLSVEGKRTQTELLREWRRFHALLHALLRGQPSSQTRELSQLESIVRDIVEQDTTTGTEDLDTAHQQLRSAVEKVLDTLEHLPDASEGLATMIPDTNALILNPRLERWQFSESREFLILLTPTVLSELDDLKMNHRIEAVRDKAKGLIRQIKEYRRRGRLADGVPLKKGTISLAASAIEPRFEDTLPWLDSANSDDRLLASVIEVMRQRPRSAVVLVTGDINLQNKAEFADIPFVEPPDA